MSRRSLVVFGGNGFVGGAVCAAAVRRGVPVVAVSRTGAPPAHLPAGDACWSGKVRWAQGDCLDPPSYAPLLSDAQAVVVSVGSPPVPADFETQRRANGATNVVVADAARKAGVPALVVVNASMPQWLDRVAPGYFHGKRDAEAAAVAFVDGRDDTHAAVLKPSAIYGTRYAGRVPIPLGLILAPASMALRLFSGTAAALRRAAPYLLEGALLPPVPVGDVARAALHHALDAPRVGQVAVDDAEKLLRAGP